MRFCPFCSAENVDQASTCGSCARRLPPLPQKRLTSAAETVAPGGSGPPGGAAGRAGAAPPPHPGRPPATAAAGPEGAPATDAAAAPGGDQPGRPGEERAGRNGHGPGRDEASQPVPPAVAGGPRETALGLATGRAPAAGATLHGGGPGGETALGLPAARLPAAAARDRAPAPTLSPVPSAQPAAAEVRDGSAAAPHDAGVGESPTPDEAALATEGGSTGDFDPPPTRVGMEAMTEHAYTPSNVAPVPEVPEAGLVPAARYTLAFLRARWQRHLAIKRLRTEISENTTALDRVLGTLGQRARALGQGGRVFAAENAAIDAAEERRKRAELSCAELQHRQAEENGKFAEIEDLRQAKVAEAEQALEKAQHELGGLEVQRRALRDRRKTIERQQRGFLKAAEEREERAVKAASGEERASARRAADDLRRDAAALDPERQDLERRMGALEKPISQCTAKVEAIRAELDSARRSLNDAREGHRYRMAEIEAEQGRKNRELAQADAEIHRRMVTLGTLINLNRIDRPEFGELYAQIDELRSAIGARSTEIDRFLAEREAFDRASLWRGSLVLGGAGLLVLALLGLVGALL